LPRTDDQQVLERGATGLAVSAPAKINLALHVVGRRADGYHLIESLSVFTRFGDRIAIEPAPSDRFAVTGPGAAAVPLDGGNLVIAARDRLRAAAHSSCCPPTSIRLEKNLPVASGIGGGSSDAAATLSGLRHAWGLAMSDEALAELGLGLGADVPMCLAGRPLVATGIGERIEALRGFPALHLVLVNPGVPVATPDVFKALASHDSPGLPPMPAQPSQRGIIEWLHLTRNDLQAPASSIAPEIAQAMISLRAAGSQFARMSGSGATCFGLFEDAARAAQAAAQIRRRQPGWFVVATESEGVPADVST
jgi:4-diphosphocytidyl-2-C-methyl-D-erythritol kinase